MVLQADYRAVPLGPLSPGRAHAGGVELLADQEASPVCVHPGHCPFASGYSSLMEGMLKHPGATGFNLATD